MFGAIGRLVLAFLIRASQDPTIRAHVQRITIHIARAIVGELKNRTLEHVRVKTHAQ